MSATTQLEAAAVVEATASLPVDNRPHTREWLTFRIGQEEYGIDILCVQEIRSFEKPTRIANGPGHVKGVVNLRGVVVPVLDLRMSLGATELGVDDATVTVVLTVGSQIVGAMVDSVCDVLQIDADEIRPFPRVATSIEPCFITGIGAIEVEGVERMLILLDIASLITSLRIGSSLAPELGEI